jgi:hypothetical protein
VHFTADGSLVTTWFASQRNVSHPTQTVCGGITGTGSQKRTVLAVERPSGAVWAFPTGTGPRAVAFVGDQILVGAACPPVNGGSTGPIEHQQGWLLTLDGKATGLHELAAPPPNATWRVPCTFATDSNNLGLCALDLASASLGPLTLRPPATAEFSQRPEVARMRDRIWAGTGPAVFWSDDGGKTWTRRGYYKVGTVLTTSKMTAVIGPSGRAEVSLDRGRTWQRRTVRLPEGDASYAVTRSGHLVVGLFAYDDEQLHLYLSTDPLWTSLRRVEVPGGAGAPQAGGNTIWIEQDMAPRTSTFAVTRDLGETWTRVLVR